MTEARFDANRDGNISRTERPREDESVRDLLDAADSDRDGVVAEQELIDELRLRAARNRILENAIRTTPGPRAHQSPGQPGPGPRPGARR